METLLEWSFIVSMVGTGVFWVLASFWVGLPFSRAWRYAHRNDLPTPYISGAVILAVLNTAESVFFAILVAVQGVDFSHARPVSTIAVFFIPGTLSLQAAAFVMMGRAALHLVEEIPHAGETA